MARHSQFNMGNCLHLPTYHSADPKLFVLLWCTAAVHRSADEGGVPPLTGVGHSYDSVICRAAIDEGRSVSRLHAAGMHACTLSCFRCEGYTKAGSTTTERRAGEPPCNACQTVEQIAPRRCTFVFIFRLLPSSMYETVLQVRTKYAGIGASSRCAPVLQLSPPCWNGWSVGDFLYA